MAQHTLPWRIDPRYSPRVLSLGSWPVAERRDPDCGRVIGVVTSGGRSFDKRDECVAWRCAHCAGRKLRRFLAAADHFLEAHPEVWLAEVGLESDPEPADAEGGAVSQAVQEEAYRARDTVYTRARRQPGSVPLWSFLTRQGDECTLWLLSSQPLTGPWVAPDWDQLGPVTAWKLLTDEIAMVGYCFRAEANKAARDYVPDDERWSFHLARDGAARAVHRRAAELAAADGLEVVHDEHGDEGTGLAVDPTTREEVDLAPYVARAHRDLFG